MIAWLRQLATLTVSAVVSWWLFLGFEPTAPQTFVPAPEPLPVHLTPVPLEPTPAEVETMDDPEPSEPEPVAQAAPAPEESPSASEAAEAPDAVLPPEAAEDEPAEDALVAASDPTEEEAPEDGASAPAPPELGSPDGEGTAAQAAEAPARAEDPAVLPVEEAMTDEALLATASAELAGDVRPGFATVLLASAEEQLAIARFFGEELVLVPRSALGGDPATARYFRLALEGTPQVAAVRGTSVLERYRHYRDLFDYEYARLPQPLRELRRSVLSRADVYLFGALLPPREWAVVVQRRDEALRASGREADDVRQFVLQYHSRPQGGFDLRVTDILFSDGSRFRPGDRPSTSETP